MLNKANDFIIGFNKCLKNEHEALALKYYRERLHEEAINVLMAFYSREEAIEFLVRETKNDT